MLYHSNKYLLYGMHCGTIQIKLTFFEHSSQHLDPQPHFVTWVQMKHHLVPVSIQRGHPGPHWSSIPPESNVQVHLVFVAFAVIPILVERMLDFFFKSDSLVKLGHTGTQCQPGYFAEEDLPVLHPLFDLHTVVQHNDLYTFDASHDELRTAVWEPTLYTYLFIS